MQYYYAAIVNWLNVICHLVQTGWGLEGSIWPAIGADNYT